MDEDLNKQIDEFSEVVHGFVCKTYTDEFKDKYHFTSDVSLFEMSIINKIYENDNVIIKDIQESFKIPKSTLTSTIDRLEKKDILKRKKNPNDGRSFILILTQKGESIKKEHDEFEKNEFKRIMECLDNKEERKMLIGLLNKILKNL